jgi:actin related protein 2/3 complex subunit 3
MPSYHSVFNENSYSTACGIPLVDFKQNKIPDLDSTKLKTPLNELDLDIIDESLIYFRANVLFKNFPIKGDADRLLVYITVFIQKCLEVAYNNSQDIDKAKIVMKNLVDDADWSPNTKSHFLNNLTNVKSNEISSLQQYLKSVRKEVVMRVMFILFDSDYKTLDLKFWLGFAKKKFLGYDMLTIRK